MKVIDVFESIASSTWQRIRLGEAYKVSQGEETITDINLLELARANCTEVQVIKTPKDKEKCQGTDWEWWIGNHRLGWLRYAVQAKKVDPRTSRYKVLGHKVHSIPQIEILEKYAKVNHAIPLYCFYNYLDSSSLISYWRCNLPYEVEQFGCTVTPSKHVRTALSERGARKFEFLHTFNGTKPWRCLVCCPLMLQVYRTGSVTDTSLNFENVTVYQTLPSDLSVALETGFLENFSSDFYSRDLEIYPKRILVANYEVDNV
ncbi:MULTISPECIES: DUF6615 family protein [Cyanophyceae]|uniref:DUF6615 family protein n=1 Tax=Cyanophyceae TaxID=3028117 RepID=UPI00168319E0|nr:DUF6615 family protein [Trichocoleus sp. FACHB-69]MBD1932399.1 hypothetical protein [Trichocoleus sp. FACHB-69]